MISRNLTRRLEELEARIAPAAEPVIIQITYVTPDGSEEDGPRIEVPMPSLPDRPWQRKRRRR
jgi:hypothetical protein